MPISPVPITLKALGVAPHAIRLALNRIASATGPDAPDALAMSGPARSGAKAVAVVLRPRKGNGLDSDTKIAHLRDKHPEPEDFVGLRQ
jgi:hypothetical protein